MKGLPPDWDDLPVLVLEWLHAPAAIIALVTLSLLVVGWVSGIIGSLRRGYQLGTAANAFWRLQTTPRVRSVLLYAITATGFVAFLVAGARLTPRYWMQSAGVGVWGDWNWVTILRTWDGETTWYMLAAAGSMFLLAVAVMVDSWTLRLFLIVPWAVVLAAGAAAGVVWLIALLGNLLMLGLLALSDSTSREYTWPVAAGFLALALTALLPAALGVCLYQMTSATFDRGAGAARRSGR